jgi:hypothetical protein
MKYYESLYEEYISSVEKINIHPELVPILEKFPKNLKDIDNMIIYGPPGIGKYSQVLSLLKKYSPSNLKYDKKIIANKDKQQYIYHISDIHYEIDMSLLGCNSKLLWHEIFFQIIDIVSVKSEKIGIIVCKNFHSIHSELLDIFYSYIQQYNYLNTHIRIKFFLITENISFIPNTIIDSSLILRMKRPSKEIYQTMISINNNIICNDNSNTKTFIQRISNYHNGEQLSNKVEKDTNGLLILNDIELESMTNIKELRSFSLIKNKEDIPKDVFIIICNHIIKEITEPNKIVMTQFRDKLYDILTYNLDMNECLWYIIIYFIENTKKENSPFLSEKDVSDILSKTYFFFKYFNNNYRPIFHLENIMYYIINKIHKFNES